MRNYNQVFSRYITYFTILQILGKYSWAPQTKIFAEPPGKHILFMTWHTNHKNANLKVLIFRKKEFPNTFHVTVFNLLLAVISPGEKKQSALSFLVEAWRPNEVREHLFPNSEIEIFIDFCRFSTNFQKILRGLKFWILPLYIHI